MEREELINRLRDVPSWAIGTETEETMLDAADALEAAEKRIADLETALKACRVQRGEDYERA